MSPGAIGLVLLSAAIHVGWNFLTKSSASPKAFSLLVGIITITIFIAAIPIIPFNLIPLNAWVYIVFSGAIHMVYFTSLSSAYETGDISFVYPIARSAPAFVPVAAFLILGEKISVRGLLGIVIVVIGVFLIQLRGKAKSELKMLWLSIKQKDSIWAFVTLGTVVFYTLVDKAGMVALSQVTEIAHGMHGPIYFLLEKTLCFLLFWIFIWRNTKSTFGYVLKYEWPKAVAATLGTMASYSLILHVMQFEIVSYIVTLRQSSVLIAVLVGRLALKEPYGRLRIIIAIVMLGGFFLVATAK